VGNTPLLAVDVRFRGHPRRIDAEHESLSLTRSVKDRICHRVTIFRPDWMSAERMALIASFGADVVPVNRDQGGFRGRIERADAQGQVDRHVFLPHQFSNAANVQAHAPTTGPEIWI
jgi:cysteine synthase A